MFSSFALICHLFPLILITYISLNIKVLILYWGCGGKGKGKLKLKKRYALYQEIIDKVRIFFYVIGNSSKSESSYNIKKRYAQTMRRSQSGKNLLRKLRSRGKACIARSNLNSRRVCNAHFVLEVFYRIVSANVSHSS